MFAQMRRLFFDDRRRDLNLGADGNRLHAQLAGDKLDLGNGFFGGKHRNAHGRDQPVFHAGKCVGEHGIQRPVADLAELVIALVHQLQDGSGIADAEIDAGIGEPLRIEVRQNCRRPVEGIGA